MIIVLNYVVARALLLAALIYAARRRPVAPLDARAKQRLKPLSKAIVELKRNQLSHRRRRAEGIDFKTDDGDDDDHSPDSVLQLLGGDSML